MTQALYLIGVSAFDRLGVAGENVVTVGYHRMQRFQVRGRLGLREARAGRDLLHRRETELFQRADVHPADVEFVPLDRKARRCGEGMVVVVQFFAADEDSERRDVAARIGGRHVPAAITPEMTNAVDDAGGPEWNPDDLRDQDQ